jgi:hypothetical protein
MTQVDTCVASVRYWRTGLRRLDRDVRRHAGAPGNPGRRAALRRDGYRAAIVARGRDDDRVGAQRPRPACAQARPDLDARPDRLAAQTTDTPTLLEIGEQPHPLHETPARSTPVAGSDPRAGDEIGSSPVGRRPVCETPRSFIRFTQIS